MISIACCALANVRIPPKRVNLPLNIRCNDSLDVVLLVFRYFVRSYIYCILLSCIRLSIAVTPGLRNVGYITLLLSSTSLGLYLQYLLSVHHSIH